MSRKAVVLGNIGQLGVELVRELRARGYEVAGWDRAEVDITVREAVEAAVAGFGPDVVYNAAAYNQVDVAEQEPEAAFQVNALAVRNIAMVCRQLDVPLIHYSTDYVFDGTATTPYKEDDRTHPLGAYGVSKLAGELYAQAYLDKVLIVRTSGVFGVGGLATARGNFVETMMRLAKSTQPLRVVVDNFASPAFAPALAARTIDLVERGHTGVFHIGLGAPVSWFEFARTIFEVAGMNPVLQPTDARQYRTPARRPRYSALSNAKMESVGLKPMPSLRESVEAYFKQRDSAVSAKTA